MPYVSDPTGNGVGVNMGPGEVGGSSGKLPTIGSHAELLFDITAETYSCERDLSTIMKKN